MGSRDEPRSSNASTEEEHLTTTELKERRLVAMCACEVPHPNRCDTRPKECVIGGCRKDDRGPRLSLGNCNLKKLHRTVEVIEQKRSVIMRVLSHKTLGNTITHAWLHNISIMRLCAHFQAIMHVPCGVPGAPSIDGDLGTVVKMVMSNTILRFYTLEGTLVVHCVKALSKVLGFFGASKDDDLLSRDHKYVR